MRNDEKETRIKYKANSMANILAIIGALEIVGSFIFGCCLENPIVIIVAGTIMGIFILAVAEVIQNIEDILKNK